MHDILFAFLKKKRWFQEFLYLAIFNKEWGYDKNTGVGTRDPGKIPMDFRNPDNVNFPV